MRQTEAGAIRKAFLAILAGWTLLIAIASYAQIVQDRQAIIEHSLFIARASHDKDVAYRRWNSLHGGVYAPVTADLPPNPWLDVPERDVTTTDGVRLTMINPAYMTRQVHEQSEASYGIKGHITSLNPIRPQNAPDAWEASALRFIAESGAREYFSEEELSGEPHLRYIKTLIAEKPCLRCHAKQGYKEGEVRGGISVSVPLAPLLLHLASEIRMTAGVNTLVWLLGCMGLLAAQRLLLARAAEAQGLLQAAEAARGEAEQAAAVKTEFLANMSHEIRTPLNGIFGMLQLLEETRLDEEQQEYVGLATQSGRNLLALLSDILDLARIEAGCATIAEERIELRPFIDTVLAVFRQEAARKGIDLAVNMAGHADLAIVGDETRMRQVLVNLVGNAVKFTDAGSVILRVEATPEPNAPRFVRLDFVVEDTGPGIADDKMETVFEPFTQADGSHTRRHGGAGLGLGIARRLARLMCGDVTLSSAPGKGTTARLTLTVPFAETRPGTGSTEGLGATAQATAASQPSPRAPQAVVSRPRALRILLAEDDALNRLAARRVLEMAGHLVECVEDGEQALAALRGGELDVVLMDIQMPVMDGLTAIRRIRAEEAAAGSPRRPILAITAHSMPGDKERIMEAGADGYLSKPLDMASLNAAIHDLIGG